MRNDQGWARAPDDTANSSTEEAASGPNRYTSSGGGNSCMEMARVANMPMKLPLATRSHSRGWVAASAGPKPAAQFFRLLRKVVTSGGSGERAGDGPEPGGESAARRGAQRRAGQLV